ncbi:MAG: methionine adenosyltransferase, partial [Gammaproteobacteria bacterium]|nr:methionine adenosyltransferase [Gammaproteobacteria bacterium]
MIKDFMFTSESVTPGHPDKLCDQISDAIVDEFLKKDITAKVRAESAVSGGVVFLAARFVSDVEVDLPEMARSVISEVGYEGGDFNAEDATVMTNLLEYPAESTRPADFSQTGDSDLNRLKANSQVTVFGFACDHTPAMMPLPIWLAHALARRLYEAGSAGDLPYLHPDGKTQVGVEFRDRKPVRIHSISLLASNREGQHPGPKAMQDDLLQAVIEPVFAGQEIRPDEETEIYINKGGLFIGGGPAHHSGLTGRKTAVDTYGEYVRHSGAALSGKDPLRIDRIAQYAARHAAVNVVAAGLASQCEVQLSYSLGQANPVSIQVDTHETGNVEAGEVVERITKHFDFRPAAIIRNYDLQRLPSATEGG